MILVAVGTQFPFDRLTRTVDDWAAETRRTDVYAQIGPSSYVPRALNHFNMISPKKFAELQKDADVIVSHAGMGSILGALQEGTPIIIMPRDHGKGEHRNDHQRATAREFIHQSGVHVAEDEAALRDLLDRVDDMRKGHVAIGQRAPEPFVERLRSFVDEAPAPRWRFAWNQTARRRSVADRAG